MVCVGLFVFFWQVDPKGSTVLVGFEDGVVRALVFQKKETIDVHGRKHKDQSELALVQAFKPHSNDVTCLAVDSRGEILATAVRPTLFLFIACFRGTILLGHELCICTLTLFQYIVHYKQVPGCGQDMAIKGHTVQYKRMGWYK